MGGKASKLKRGKKHRRSNAIEIEEFEDVEEYVDYQGNQHLNDCKKNPDHKDFFQVKDFTINNLPTSLQTDSVLKYVMAHEKLVVRIKVGNNSPKRVKYSNHVGHVGTGYAWCAGEKSEFPCPGFGACGENPHNVYGGIVIYTNHHVVLDDFEAKEAEVMFFYNSLSNTNEKKIDSANSNVASVINNVNTDLLTDKNPIYAHGHSLRELSTKKDLVGLEIYFHDERLYDLVSKFHNDIAKAWQAVPHSYRESFKEHAIIISHPHGCVKGISVGDLHVLEQEEEKIFDIEHNEDDEIMGEDNNNVITTTTNVPPPSGVLKKLRKVTKYTTATCPGSSGAPVLTGYYHNPERPFTHTGFNNDLGVNYSISY